MTGGRKTERTETKWGKKWRKRRRRETLEGLQPGFVSEFLPQRVVVSAEIDRRGEAVKNSSKYDFEGILKSLGL